MRAKDVLPGDVGVHGRGRGRRLLQGLAIGVVATLGMSVSAGLGVLTATPAQAAAPGQYAVGAQALALTQPADALLGRSVPTGDADTRGMFGPQVGWPVIPIHATLLPNGHLLTYGTPVASARQAGITYDNWNPALGMVDASHTQTASMATYDSFCNALQTLPDGRLVMVGGNTTMNTMFYEPVTKAESMGANLNNERWYATVLRLPDDRMLVMGGANYYNVGAYRTPDNNARVGLTPEIGTGTGAWTRLTGAANPVAFGARDNRWWYPRAFNGPDGRVFGISDDQMWRLSAVGAGSVTSLGAVPAGIGVSGSAVMYAPGQILLAGGGQAENGDQVLGNNATTTIDINRAAPVVTPRAPMANRRNWLNLTVLPTGEVLANGGTVVGTNGGAANSSYATELWNPTTRTWRVGASAQRIRTYHSTAVLMPSGAVFTGGGGVPGPEDNFNSELYYPPYLFSRGADGVVKWADRPTLTSIAGNLTWGGAVTLGTSDARGISSVSLITATTQTHSLSTDQRRIPLTFTRTGASVTAQIPANRNIVPPGTYMLQVVDANGVPSPSQMVTIRNGRAGSATVFEADQSAVYGVGGTGPAADGSVPLTVGATIGLESVNLRGYRVRHRDYNARIDSISADSPELDQADASFVVRAGLASSAGFSFESVNYPGLFLSAVNGQVVLRGTDGSAGFAGNSTFRPTSGLTGQNTSFALWSDPARYLRHMDFGLRVDPFDGSDLGRADATFSVRRGFVSGFLPGARIGLESVNYPGRRVRHYNFDAQLDPISASSAAIDLQDSSFVVRPGLGGRGWSLESVNLAGSYLRVLNGRLVVQANDRSAGFAAAATFTVNPGLSGQGYSLSLADQATQFVRHAGFLVYVQPLDGSALARADASFRVVPALS